MGTRIAPLAPIACAVGQIWPPCGCPASGVLVQAAGPAVPAPVLQVSESATEPTMTAGPGDMAGRDS